MRVGSHSRRSRCGVGDARPSPFRLTDRCAPGGSSPLPTGEGQRPSGFAWARTASSIFQGSDRASALVKRITGQRLDLRLSPVVNQRCFPSPVGRRWPRSGRMRVGSGSRRSRRGTGNARPSPFRLADRYAPAGSSPLPTGEGQKPRKFAWARIASSMRQGSERASWLVKRITVQPRASISLWRR